MLTDSLKSFDDILKDISNENYPESPSKGVFERFLNATLMNLDCDKPPQKERLFDLNCHPVATSKNIGVHYHLLSILSESKLNGLLDFFSKYVIDNKNTLNDDYIKNLIHFGNHYALVYETKLNKTDSKFSENDIQTTSSFINFLSSLFDIHNITEFETPGLIHQNVAGSMPNITFSDIQGIDMLVGHSNKLTLDLIKKLNNTEGFTYKEVSFLDLLQNLGDLGFKLKLKEEFAFQAEQIQRIAKTIVLSTNSQNFNDTFKKSAVWEYSNRYNDKTPDAIENNCRDLFGFENCLPPDNENTRIIYEKILKKTIKPADLNTINYQLIIDKLSQGTPENIANQLNSLSGNNKLTNCINFFKDYLKQNNNTLNEIYLKKTFKLCNAINEIATASKTSLRNTANKLDIKYFKMIQAQLALVLNLVKSNSEEKSLHDQIHSISQLENLVIDVIKNYHDHKYSNKTDENVKNIPKSYLDIINYSKDSDSSLHVSSNSFAKSIKEVTKACLNSEACNNTEIKKQSFEMLGGMVRKLEQVHRIHLAKEVINSAKELKNIIKNNNNISDAELGSDVANFLRIRHARNQIFMDKDCKDIFALNPQDCFPRVTINKNITSTTTPASAPQRIANTTASAINQTGGQETSTFSLSPISFPETPSTTEIITDIVQNLGSQFPTITEVGTTSAHSLGSSLINFMTQVTSIWLRNKGYGESIISAISLSLAGGILQASYTATFRLMLFKLNQLVAEGNETEAQAQWDMMTQEMLPTFFISLSLSTGLQLLNYLSENYLSKQSMLKGLVQSIPTLSSLWSFTRSPILGGIHVATAYGVSAAGLFGFNRYWGARNRHADVEEAEQNEHEMRILNEKKVVETSPTDTITGTKIPEKIYQYITEENFNQIKNQFEGIIKALESLVTSLEQSTEKDRAKIECDTNPAVAEAYQTIIDHKSQVLQIIKLEVENSTQEISFLKDDHKAAYQKHIVDSIHTPKEKKEIKTAYSSAMEKLGNVFKRMEPMFNNMKINLGTAHGYVKGASKSFAGDDHTLASLDEIMYKIQFPLSSTRTYVSTYNTWSAAEQAEKNGAKNALANQGKFNSDPPLPTATLRKKTNGILTNRACSMYSDRTRSSESDTSNNSEFDPLVPQQKRELIHAKT